MLDYELNKRFSLKLGAGQFLRPVVTGIVHELASY
jgi:hypothetical protein